MPTQLALRFDRGLGPCPPVYRPDSIDESGKALDSGVATR
jgi:hypothetical protein